MNETTETIWYNKRIIIDSNLYSDDMEPRAWLVSKVNRITPRGICHVTMTQDRFDQHHDYIERDEDGNVIGYWADYFQSAAEPQDAFEPSTTLFSSITSEITVPGNHQIKTGSYKTFTVTYYEDDVPIEHDVGEWSVLLDGVDATDLVTITPGGNKARIKFNGGDDYIGKILRVINTSGEIVSTLDVEVIAL